ncbi:hypothetical protein EAO68_33020 [Streptomyces sp. wa22]|nr:hypothetical protein EAO68_33020 [Streptomyces sp. wa22]
MPQLPWPAWDKGHKGVPALSSQVRGLSPWASFRTKAVSGAVVGLTCLRRRGRIGAPEGATDRSGGSAMPASRVRAPGPSLAPTAIHRSTTLASAAPRYLGASYEGPFACTACGHRRS